MKKQILQIKEKIKKFIFYLILIFIFIASINFAIPVASDVIIYSIKIYQKISRTVSGVKDNPYHKPNFRNLDWAEKHFEEFIKLKVDYHDYLIWRRLPFNGETIKIDQNGFRLNNNNQDMVSFKNSKAWFFGGSTMWGSGAKNEDTIPSAFEKISQIKSANFGETGYTSTQELNLLIKYINFSNPKLVIFYDGANDIYSKCRKENNFYSSSIEKKIKPVVEEKVFKDWYNIETKNLFTNNIEVTKKLKNFLIKTFSKEKNKKLFDCDTNEKKAKLIVQNLIDNWSVARFIVENQNDPGVFIPILQPLSFFTKSKIDHLNNDNNEIKNQFDYMYRLLKIELKKKNFEYYDFTSVIDDNEYYFWDDVHISPNGNKKIAEAIFKEVSKLKLYYGN